MQKYVRAIGPRLRLVLFTIFGLFAILSANSLYLGSISFVEYVQGVSYQGYFYQMMFLAHLVLGLLLILPVLIFGVIHARNSWSRPNRRAVRVGFALFFIAILVLLSGLALMRLGFFEIKDLRLRSPIYWIHIVTPLFAVWLYVLHRLAGPRIKWRIGRRWAVAVLVLVGTMTALHTQDPRKWSTTAPATGAKYFDPSLARTATGNFIPAEKLMLDDYCQRCHQDAHRDWQHSAHRYSSFNNPPYLFSVRETRRVSLERDGNVHAARWCAGCHDVVPFFSGAFDNPKFDDVNDPTGQAGLTCVACHSITKVNSTRGNADYTIEEPQLYPFTTSTNPVLRYINEILVKAKPELHKRTFLKPVHKTAEFCSTCHKVSLPYALNHYKEFLRGQNHYDGFLLSGVSGHGARAFYHPEVAKQKCADCHMPLYPSHDFAAKLNAPPTAEPQLTVHSHRFPGGNTGIAALKQDEEMLATNTAFLRTAARVDLFGVKSGGTIDSPLTAPLRPSVPALVPGRTYLFETVVRTLGVGHPLTQGTVDSNELWLDVTVTAGDRVVGRSGGLGAHREVDPWAYFLNVYMLDREGRRIDRRNAQDIFTPLYDHQIPPGAGQVVHYAFTVPQDAQGPLTVHVALRYRKFDAIYVNYFSDAAYKAGDPLTVANNLPIATLAEDSVSFPLASTGTADAPQNQPSAIPLWQRWNDFGIGLLSEGDRGASKGELIQAASAFAEVEKLGRPDGPLNLARVYLKEGRLDDAIVALQRATSFDPPAPRWTLAWLNGSANKLAGNLDRAIADFRSIVDDRYSALEERHFDFSKDYLVLTELGQTLMERAKAERSSPERRTAFLREAAATFDRVLALDSENAAAHYNLALIHTRLGDDAKAAEHQNLYNRYRVDNNATDRAIALARRRDKAADHAAEAIVIYSLQRLGAPELPPPSTP
ncbi:hypothetical protein DB347_06975 [Opitutaceae bacterium EW11]|nr:hypothetical protein DB347_06975 [Opitutaceae bacterium EW11]